MMGSLKGGNVIVVTNDKTSLSLRNPTIDDVLEETGLDAIQENPTKANTCVFCEKEFDYQSLLSHQLQCQEQLWHKRGTKSSPRLSLSPRQSPTRNKKDESPQRSLSQTIGLQIRRSSMMRCRHCSKTFDSVDTLVAHQKICKPGSSAYLPSTTKKSSASALVVRDDATNSDTSDPSLSPSPKLKRFGTSSDSLLMGGPLMFACCYCGREYSSFSLKLHISKCLTKWKSERALIPPQLQQPIPPPPDLTDIEKMDHTKRRAFNEQATTTYRDHCCVKCSVCSRSFNGLEKLTKHLNDCNGTAGKEAAAALLSPARHRLNRSLSPASLSGKRGGNEATDEQRPNVSPDPSHTLVRAAMSESFLTGGPSMFVCCYCGREFSSVSLKAHMGRCLTKWTSERSQLPLHLQRPIPPLPNLTSIDTMSQAQRRMFNENTINTYTESCCITCSLCSRTFSGHEKYSKHLGNCDNKDSTAAPVSPSPSPTPSPKPSLSRSPSLSPSPQINHSAIQRSPSPFSLGSTNNEGETPNSGMSILQQQQQRFLVGGPSMFVCCFCGSEYSSNTLKRHAPKVSCVISSGHWFWA
eukprot:c12399_g1_i3.p1 GENE.c12399_g1_i3~~c12399_g1_i3.p1  ORF type:complete len:596 (+),score=111.68 c12399_g1_i3:50-1789(+)